MTQALDAMVRVMLAELKRQGEGGRPGPYVLDGVSDIDPEPDFNAILIDGHVDLEKVARAGLEAIRDHTDDKLGLALNDLPGGYRPGSHSATAIWRNQVAAILEPKPGERS